MKKYILLLILFATLFPFQSITAQEEGKKLTMEDAVHGREFYPKSVYGLKSMKDGQHYCTREKDSLNMYEYKTGKYGGTIVSSRDLVPEGDTVPIRLFSFQFSKDESKLLIPTETESIYRHSSKSDYYVYDIEGKKLSFLSLNGKQRLADFSPDATKVAFIRDNNIYVKDLNSGEEKQITADGEDRKIINGTTDWVYEEEFGFTKAFFWSPDGSKIAFYRFDESDVNEFNMQMWGELYPEDYRYKYPKAGEDNSLVTIHVYNLGTGEVTEMDIGQETDQYIPRIKWTEDANKLSILRMNRLQNYLEILLADAGTGATEVI